MKFIKISLIVLMMFSIVGCKENTKTTNNENKAVTEVEFAITKPQSKNIEIKGAVGKLKGILQTPEMQSNQKYPLVILMHGVFSNKEFPLVEELANRLQKEGIASIRFDFNGHGESDGEFINMTVPLEIEDGEAVFYYAKKLDFVSTISLMGHSQGGVVASLLAGKLGSEVESLALFAPAAVMEDQAGSGQMMGVTFDPKNPPEYIEVFNHQVGRDYLISTPKLDIYNRAEKYTGSVCIIHGKVDRVVPYKYGETYNERYKNSELHILDNADHVFTNNIDKAAEIGIDFFKKLKTK